MTGVRACVEPVEAVCQPRDLIDCSSDIGTGQQLCMDNCSWSGCMYFQFNCNEPVDTPCGRCNLGTKSGECDTLTGLRASVEPSNVCTPRDFENCLVPYDGGNWAGTRVCTDACEWTTCEPVVIN
jgi:hypothetical protein